jgi:hypothetical protein
VMGGHRRDGIPILAAVSCRDTHWHVEAEGVRQGLMTFRFVNPKRNKRSMMLHNLYLEDCGSIWFLFTGLES